MTTTTDERERVVRELLRHSHPCDAWVEGACQGTCKYGRKLFALYDAGRRIGAEEERAAVVAYLKTTEWRYSDAAAVAIERAAHRTKEES